MRVAVRVSLSSPCVRNAGKVQSHSRVWGFVSPGKGHGGWGGGVEPSLVELLQLHHPHQAFAGCLTTPSVLQFLFFLLPLKLPQLLSEHVWPFSICDVLQQGFPLLNYTLWGTIPWDLRSFLALLNIALAPLPAALSSPTVAGAELGNPRFSVR